MRLVTLFEYVGLGAALVGALSFLRGDWGTAAECFGALIVSAFLAGWWETE